MVADNIEGDTYFKSNDRPVVCECVSFSVQLTVYLQWYMFLYLAYLIPLVSFSSRLQHQLSSRWIHCGCDCFSRMQGEESCLCFRVRSTCYPYQVLLHTTRRSDKWVVHIALHDLSQQRHTRLGLWNLRLWVCDGWRDLPHSPLGLHADSRPRGWGVHLWSHLCECRIATSSNEWQLWSSSGR